MFSVLVDYQRLLIEHLSFSSLRLNRSTSLTTFALSIFAILSIQLSPSSWLAELNRCSLELSLQINMVLSLEGGLGRI